MDLNKFKKSVEDWRQQNNLNLALSGVARLGTEIGIIWSASFSVTGEGFFPYPQPSERDNMERLLQQLPSMESFSLCTVDSVEFVMCPDLQSTRWQVKWKYCV